MGIAPSTRPGRPPMPSLIPPPPGPFLSDAYYQTGTADPRLRHDPGAGAWRSKPATAGTVAQLAAIRSILGVPTMVYPGTNATKHMEHYLNNTGRDYVIDLEDMIASVPTAKRAMIAEFRQAQNFITALPNGTHYFTSRAGESAYNYKGESADWFFAIGGYTYWGKGVAKVSAGTRGRLFEVDFEYHVYDRYNWDGGKKVTIGGIEVTDEFMGEFHRQGLAKEFDCHGKIARRFTWEGAATPGEQAILKKPGR